jgi:histone deacetylase 6
MDEDYTMTEDVVNSTEVNGSHETVDPSVITLDGSIQSPLPIRKDPPPFLSHQTVAPPDSASYHASPTMKSEEGPASSDSFVPEYTATESSYDDVMDVESSPSPVLSQVLIPPLTRYIPLPYASGRTGLVYDVRMRFHAEPPNVAMPEDIHPEDPRRIHEIFDEIRKAGLVQGPEDSDEDVDAYKCFRIGIRPATRGEICLIHTEEHYNFIKSLQCKSYSIMI